MGPEKKPWEEADEMRQRTILRPTVQAKPGVIPFLRDYILVDAVTTYGTWKVLDLVPVETGALLMLWTNAKEQGQL